MSEIPTEPPGSFGYPKDLQRDLKALRAVVEERTKKIMADIQTLSDAIDQQGQTIQQEAQEVKNQLDQMTATIEELRNQVAPDVQPLVDKLTANNDAIRAIFTGEEPPAPTGRQRP